MTSLLDLPIPSSATQINVGDDVLPSPKLQNLQSKTSKDAYLSDISGFEYNEDCYAVLPEFLAWCQATGRTAVFNGKGASDAIVVHGSNIPMCANSRYERGFSGFNWYPGGTLNAKGIPMLADGTTWDMSRHNEALFVLPNYNTKFEDFRIVCYAGDGGTDVADTNIANMVANGLFVRTGSGILTTDGSIVDLDLSNKYHKIDAFKAFPPGFTAVRTIENGRGQIINLDVLGVKHAIVLDSVVGHWTMQRCAPTGSSTSMIYCKSNSEDFQILDCQNSAALTMLMIGDQICAGHNGGMAVRREGNHWGYGPYGILQVHDNYVDPNDNSVAMLPASAGLPSAGVSVMPNGCNGIYQFAELNESWEEVGEMRMRLHLDSSSSFFGGHENSTGEAYSGGYDLPTNMLPTTAEVADAAPKKYLFGLGNIDQWTTTSSVVFTPFSDTGKVAYINSLSDGFDETCSDISYLGGVDMVDMITAPIAAHGPGSNSGPYARKDDFLAQAILCPVGNEFADPRLAASYDYIPTGSASSKFSALVSAGTLEALSGDEEIQEALGTDFDVMVITNPTANSELDFNLHMANGNVAYGSDSLFINMFILFKSTTSGLTSTGVFCRPNTAAGPRLYDGTTGVAPNVWTRISKYGTISADTITSLALGVQNCTSIYLAGVMGTRNKFFPFNPNSGPGVVDVSKVKTSLASAGVGEFYTVVNGSDNLLAIRRS